MRVRGRLRPRRGQTNRRPGITPGRRCALAIAVAVAVACLSGGIAYADTNSGQLVTATVYGPGGSKTTDSVSVGGLESNPGNCPTYSGPGPDLHPSGADVNFSANTWTLATVLGCLSPSIAPPNVTGITIYQSNGAPESSPGSELTRSDLATPSAFQDPQAVPVIWSDGTNLNYYRPWRGGDDSNKGDLVNDSPPSALLLDVFEGQPINVKLTLSQSTIDVGASVSFSASASGPGVSGVSFSWNISGGTPATASGPSTKAQFTYPGNQFRVTVQATDTAGGGGQASALVTVNSKKTPPPTTGNQPTGPTGNGKTPPVGPTTPNGPGGHTVSPGTHPTKPGGGGTGTTPQSNPNPGGSGNPANKGTTPHHHIRHKQRATHKTTPAAATTAPHSGKSAQHSASGSQAANTTQRSAPAHSSSPVRGRPALAPARTASGQLVSGRLISDVTPLPATASPLVHLATAAAAKASAELRSSHSSAIALLAGIVGVVLLLGLGAARELRGRRAWRALRYSG